MFRTVKKRRDGKTDQKGEGIGERIRGERKEIYRKGSEDRVAIKLHLRRRKKGETSQSSDFLSKEKRGKRGKKGGETR